MNPAHLLKIAQFGWIERKYIINRESNLGRRHLQLAQVQV